MGLDEVDAVFDAEEDGVVRSIVFTGEQGRKRRHRVEILICTHIYIRIYTSGTGSATVGLDEVDAVFDAEEDGVVRSIEFTGEQDRKRRHRVKNN